MWRKLSRSSIRLHFISRALTERRRDLTCKKDHIRGRPHLITYISMQCSQRDRLRSQYEWALKVLAECVDDLGSPFTAATFGPKMIAAHSAKDVCVASREAWQSHIREHRCDRVEDSNSMAA
jgi:hypothetical protein